MAGPRRSFSRRARSGSPAPRLHELYAALGGAHLGVERSDDELRAAATGLAASSLSGWVLPWWLTRRTDPRSPDHRPAWAGARPYAANDSHRSFTWIGARGAAARAAVDPRGLLTPGEGGWSIDWWVGAGERWRRPSEEAVVRQRALGGAPVVETVVRVPGGEAAARVYVAELGSGWGPAAVIEVENASATPIAVAFAVRPFDLAGVAPISRLACRAEEVEIDGRVALLLPRPPSSAFASNLAGGDVAALLDAAWAWQAPNAGAGGEVEAAAACEAGLATAAVVYPLAARALVRAAAPLTSTGATNTGSTNTGLTNTGSTNRGLTNTAPTGANRRSGRGAAVVPGAAQVAAGWASHRDRGARLEPADPRLGEAVTAARAHLLASAEAPAPAGREAALVTAALGAYGYDDEAGAVLLRWAERLAPAVAGERRLSPAAALDHAAFLGAAGAELRRRPLRRLAEALAEPAQFALARLAGGPLPGGAAELSWRAAGLRGASDVLRTAGEAFDEAALAADAQRAAEAARAALPGPPGDSRIDALTLVWPLDLLDRLGPAAPALEQALDWVSEARLLDGGVHRASPPCGLSCLDTAVLGHAELALRRPSALDRLDWLLSRARPEGVWPSAFDPRTGWGSGGHGHDPAVGAAFLLLVARLHALDDAAGLDVCPLLSPAQRGVDWAVHELSTRWGVLSYALRWHGPRPALLWELTPPAAPGPSFALRAGALDPSFAARELAGEALLAAPPEGPAGASFR